MSKPTRRCTRQHHKPYGRRRRANKAQKPRQAGRVHPLIEQLRTLLQPLFQSSVRRARVRWTPLMLCLCAVVMAWDRSPSLAERFEQAGLSLSLLLPRRRRGGSYQGFIKALRRCHGGRLHEKVAQVLRERMRELGELHGHWLQQGWCALAADGSKFGCPRTDANEQAFGCGGRRNGPPQQLLCTLWHMGLGLPWAWDTSGVAGGSERELLRGMMHLLPEASLLVADAGFVGYDLLRQIMQRKCHLLIRVGRNVHLLSKLGFAVHERGDTVYLWPRNNDRRRQRASGRHSGQRRCQQPPLVLRLIRLPAAVAGKADVCLLSDVHDPRALSTTAASILYRMRWGVELFYRSLKQTLQRRTLHSQAPAQARLELHWAVMGVWVMGLIGVRAVMQGGYDPLDWSVAMAARALRRAAQQAPAKAHDLAEKLAKAIKDDGYQRHAAKTKRAWPAKRPQRPPGEPQIQPATAAEITLCKEVYGDKVAA